VLLGLMRGMATNGNRRDNVKTKQLIEPLFEIVKPLPPLQIWAGDNRCGLMARRVVGLFGQISPAVPINVLYSRKDDELYAATISAEIRSYKVLQPSVAIDDIRKTTKSYRASRPVDSSPIESKYTCGAPKLKAFVAEINPLASYSDVCGRPVCPYCFRWDGVIIPSDEEPRRKRHPEPYCVSCSGRISLMPRRPFCMLRSQSPCRFHLLLSLLGKLERSRPTILPQLPTWRDTCVAYVVGREARKKRHLRVPETGIATVVCNIGRWR
jgi:hypothetical protein